MRMRAEQHTSLLDSGAARRSSPFPNRNMWHQQAGAAPAIRDLLHFRFDFAGFYNKVNHFEHSSCNI